jgi:hypothetical protein
VSKKRPALIVVTPEELRQLIADEVTKALRRYLGSPAENPDREVTEADLARARRVLARYGVFDGPRVPTASPVIYFLRNEHQHIKIGTTRHLESRLDSLRGGYYGRLQLLATMPGGRDQERSLHERFAHLRIRGEWFHEAPELLAFVESLGGKTP